MSKNKVIKKRKDPIADPSGGSWVSGPIDWPDVAVIQRALETWSKGAKLDFEVTEDLFYKLLSCKGADDDEFFDFGDNGIRWRDQLARNHVQRQQRATASAAAHLDFPTTLSAAARWYCFAQVYTECSLPGFAAQVLEAHSYEDAVVLLQDANRAAKALVQESSKKLLNTPQKPANGYFIAQKARDEARQRQLVIASCLEALRTAESNKVKSAYLTELDSAGLSNARIEYPALLRLTTLGARALGEGGDYALRMDGGRVVGIGPGSGSPAFDPLYEDGDLLAMADHQSDAVLDLPTSAKTLVTWVVDQGGGVQFAIPDSDELPETPRDWVSEVARLAPLGVTPAMQGGEAPKTANAKEQSGHDALQLVLKELGATGQSVARDLEEAVRRKLLAAATDDNADLIGFRNDGGVLKTKRKQVWSEHDKEALIKRIKTQLNRL